MLFPYGDTNVPNGRFPVVNYSLIAINTLVFFFQAQLPPEQLESFVFSYGFIPAESLSISVLSSMFLHGGIMHLIGNMVFLWLFGDNIEQTIGRGKYLMFYLLAGFAATLTHYISTPDSAIPAIGASGAIAGIMGAYLVMFPHSQIKMLWLFFPFRISAFLFLGFWIVQQLFSGTASLSVPTEETTGVAWWAHIGGFVFGVTAGFYFKKFKTLERPKYAGNPWKPVPADRVKLYS